MQIDGMSPELARQGIRLQVLVLPAEEPSTSESQRSGVESTGGVSRSGSAHALSAVDLNVSLLKRFLGDTWEAQGSAAGPSQGVAGDHQSRASQSEVTSSSRSEALDQEGRRTTHANGKGGAHGKGGGGLGDAMKADHHETDEVIAETLVGEIRQLSSCQPLLHCGRHRVLANTAFRGDLEITPDLKIKVCLVPGGVVQKVWL